jgi:hypothetical protein
MLAILHLLVMFVADLFKPQCRLEAENLFLRHQLSIALRRAPPRLRLRGVDRALLVWMTRLWPSLVVPENSIRADSRVEAESEHHPGRCLHAFSCLGCLSPTWSGRGASLKSRTSFFAISSILL